MGRRKTTAAPSPAKQEISEDEQWRLINQTDLLQKINDSSDSSSTPDTPDEIFNSLLFIIPFSFLYMAMDILIHTQYAKQQSFAEYTKRVLSAIPFLSVLVFYVNRHKHLRVVALGLFVTSILAGMRLIWLVNRANWLVVIRQGPPLATLWIYSIAVLDLAPAVVGLLIVALWFWWKNMKLIF